MRILLLGEYYCRLGGTEHYIFSISEEFERLGHTVAVVYGDDLGRAPLTVGRGLHKLPEIMGRGKPAPDAFQRIQEILHLEKPDVVYAHNVPNAAVLEAFAASVPTVRYVHDHRLFCPAGDKTLRRKGEACNRPCGAGCLVQAYAGRCLPRNPWATVPLVRAKLAEMEASRRLPIAVASGYMRDCLASNRFDVQKIAVIPYFCAAGGEAPEEEYLLFAGRILRQKGLMLLLEAMHLIPGVQLKVAGAGPDLERCRRVARAAGLDGRVEFLGMLPPPALRAAYAACLALAVPSVWPEPFGIVGIEAMAAAKPVVAFDVGGVREWLIDGVNGVAVSPQDVEGLAAALSALCASVARRRRLGAAGRELWAARFTAEQHMAALLPLLESAAEAK